MTARASRAAPLAVVAAAALAGAAGAAQLAALARVFAGRAGFPADLEWMEGGTLVHALRVAGGQSLYVPPSLDFIPFLYTPLYPALLALLSPLAGLGYALGRAVSVASFTFAAAVIVVLAARQGGEAAQAGAGAAAAAAASPRRRVVVPALVGLAGAGVVAAGYTFSGAFYDLVRGDSLLLMLEAAAVWTAVACRSKRSAVACGVLIVLAFFTKQTAALLGVGLGLGLLAADWRRGLIYGATAAALLAAGIGLFTWLTDGWFWTYIFKLHQGHGFDRKMALFKAPLLIVEHAPTVFGALAASTATLAALGLLERRDFILAGVALGGFAAACVGRGTQWAFENAFIPAIYFPALATTVLCARLASVVWTDRAAARTRAAAAAVVCVLALGLQSVRAGWPDRAVLVPRAADRAAAHRLLAMVRSLPGDVFIPFHPYYAVAAGKRPFVHRMGVMDVTQAGLGRPRGLDEAIAGQAFSHVVLDWKSVPWEWPLLEARYHAVRELRDGVDSVRSFSGAETSIRTLYTATRAAPRRDGEIVIGDFEGGRWGAWISEGDAFGPAPGPAPAGMFGRAAADSGRGGEAARGSLRSAPFRAARARLAFELSGPADPGLRVLLLAGAETVRAAVATGARRTVQWDIADLADRDVVLVLDDASPSASLAVDHVVLH